MAYEKGTVEIAHTFPTPGNEAFEGGSGIFRKYRPNDKDLEWEKYVLFMVGDVPLMVRTNLLNTYIENTTDTTRVYILIYI
jgi:hypothetical protein